MTARRHDARQESTDARAPVYPAGAGPMLAAAGVSKRYGAVRALNSVVLTIEPGEVVALCGENGSGKSTLGKVIAGAVQPDAGEILLDGRPVAFEGPDDALRAGIALVAQEPTAVPAMTIAENVLLTTQTFKRPWSRVRRRALAAAAAPHLDAVGLGRVDPLLPFGALAQGQRELVEVAKALASSPRVLILDEVTTRLPDPDDLFALVRERCRDGLSVVLITHRLREVRELADRAVVLRDGALAGVLARDELSDARISSMMVGRELDELYRSPDTTPGPVVLEVRDLVTDRSGHSLSLQVRAGEIVGLAGLVGAGRSELLETIAGARPPRGGDVRVAGQQLAPTDPRTTMRAGISLLPEDRHQQGLVLGASIERNIGMVGLSAFGRTDRARERRTAQEAVDQLRIRCPSIEAPVAALSGGNQQKVVFARTLAPDPSVLLLDEPTRGVDIGAREEIYRIICEQAERGVGVLVASSDMVELLGLCSRIFVMHEGEIAGELRGEQASESAILALAAGIDPPEDPAA